MGECKKCHLLYSLVLGCNGHSVKYVLNVLLQIDLFRKRSHLNRNLANGIAMNHEKVIIISMFFNEINNTVWGKAYISIYNILWKRLHKFPVAVPRG